MCFTSTFQSYLGMPSLLRYEAYKGFEAADRQHVWVHSASKACFSELKKAKPEMLRQKHRTWQGTVHLVSQAVKEEDEKKPKTHPLLLIFSSLLVLRWLKNQLIEKMLPVRLTIPVRIRGFFVSGESLQITLFWSLSHGQGHLFPLDQVDQNSRDGSSATFLDNLFQSLSTLSVKNFCLISNLSLLSFSLNPVPLFLSLLTC